jgi:hypothetical protein
MRRTLFVLTLVVCTALSLGAQSDIIARLGSSVDEANNAIFSAFSTGTVYMAGTSEVFKSANAQARAAMVTSVIGVARAFTASADFNKRWGVYREQQKPSAPETGPTSMSALQAQQKKGFEEAIKNLEEAAKKMPQLKATFDEQIKSMREQIAELSKSDPAANAEMDAIFKQGAEQAQLRHKQALAEWEKNYPVDPKPFIARRLREFLALSATVDYTATLVKKDGVMKFEKPDYERKNAQWKYMYRAGKPAVDAARAAAQEWLKTLGG